MGHVTITTPLSGKFCHRWSWNIYDWAVYQIWNLYIVPLHRYERRRKMQKLAWFGG